MSLPEIHLGRLRGAARHGNPVSEIRCQSIILKSGVSPSFLPEKMRKDDTTPDYAYYPQGKRWWFRLHEKGGNRHEVPAHNNAEEYVDAYLDAAGIAGEKKTPLFRSFDRHRKLTGRPMHPNDAWRMVKRRAKANTV